jgi:hypothetical protein
LTVSYTMFEPSRPPAHGEFGAARLDALALDVIGEQPHVDTILVRSGSEL